MLVAARTHQTIPDSMGEATGAYEEQVPVSGTQGERGEDYHPGPGLSLHPSNPCLTLSDAVSAKGAGS